MFNEVQPIVASALEGCRVCVFAYGQTGSGKTYTMEGPKADRYVVLKYRNINIYSTPTSLSSSFRSGVYAR